MLEYTSIKYLKSFELRETNSFYNVKVFQGI